jgi:hypothetical protein
MFSDPNTVTAALFARPSGAGMAYIQQGINQYMQAAPQAPSYVRDWVTEGYERFRESDLGRSVQAIRYKLRNFWQADAIRPMWDVGDIQQAPPTMQRWAMAHPATRELYHEGRIEGYGEQYHDPQPNAIGVEQYDYRRATTGVVMPKYTLQELEDDGDLKQVEQYSNHYEKYLGNDAILAHLDKAAIQITWGTQDAAIEEGRSDPTSQWNSTIG